MTIVKWNKPSDNGQFNQPVLFDRSFSELFKNFFGDSLQGNSHSPFVPMVNAWEEKDKFIIELSAPGFSKEDFSIELENSLLSISGKTQKQDETENKEYLRKEFNYSAFDRKFNLPDNIDEDSVLANYQNGILSISIKKKEEEKLVKKITIS